MLIIEFNDGEFELECISSTFSGGFDQNGLNLKIRFRELPDIIRKFALTRNIINSIKIYERHLWKYKKYFTSYIYVVVNSISHDEGDDFYVVYMDALKTENASTNTHRLCGNPKCNYPINYLLVMVKLLEIVSKEVAEDIWDSEMIIVYCCSCFNEMFNKPM